MMIGIGCFSYSLVGYKFVCGYRPIPMRYNIWAPCALRAFPAMRPTCNTCAVFYAMQPTCNTLVVFSHNVVRMQYIRNLFMQCCQNAIHSHAGAQGCAQGGGQGAVKSLQAPLRALLWAPRAEFSIVSPPDPPIHNCIRIKKTVTCPDDWADNSWSTLRAHYAVGAVHGNDYLTTRMRRLAGESAYFECNY
jgi:hypothetical protein